MGAVVFLLVSAYPPAEVLILPQPRPKLEDDLHSCLHSLEVGFSLCRSQSSQAPELWFEGERQRMGRQGRAVHTGALLLACPGSVSTALSPPWALLQPVETPLSSVP